jgi:hypothetical protein
MIKYSTTVTTWPNSVVLMDFRQLADVFATRGADVTLKSVAAVNLPAGSHPTFGWLISGLWPFNVSDWCDRAAAAVHGLPVAARRRASCRARAGSSCFDDLCPGAHAPHVSYRRMTLGNQLLTLQSCVLVVPQPEVEQYIALLQHGSHDVPRSLRQWVVAHQASAARSPTAAVLALALRGSRSGRPSWGGHVHQGPSRS